MLSDRGAVGGFLAGLAGYRARPSLLEAMAYTTYLLAAGTLIFGLSPSGRSAQPVRSERAGVA